MATVCLLTQGFGETCDDGLGGIEAGEFLIAQKESITGSTISGGEITAIVQAGGTSFFRYFMKKEMADALATGTKDSQTGALVYETIINGIFNKITKEKNTEFKLLAAKPLVIIYKDASDGLFHGAGFEKGVELLTQTGGTGKELNTQNGYNLNFTDRSGNYPFIVDPAVVTGLVIA